MKKLIIEGWVPGNTETIYKRHYVEHSINGEGEENHPGHYWEHVLADAIEEVRQPDSFYHESQLPPKKIRVTIEEINDLHKK